MTIDDKPKNVSDKVEAPKKMNSSSLNANISKANVTSATQNASKNSTAQ